MTNKKSSRGSKSPDQQHEQLPEMELEVLARLLRSRFDVVTDFPQNEPYWVRFLGKPFNSFLPDCRSVRIMAHNRGATVSPFHIKHVLQKFAISERDFMEAYRAEFMTKPRLESPDLIDRHDGKAN